MKKNIALLNLIFIYCFFNSGFCPKSICSSSHQSTSVTAGSDKSREPLVKKISWKDPVARQWKNQITQTCFDWQTFSESCKIQDQKFAKFYCQAFLSPEELDLDLTARQFAMIKEICGICNIHPMTCTIEIIDQHIQALKDTDPKKTRIAAWINTFSHEAFRKKALKFHKLKHRRNLCRWGSMLEFVNRSELKVISAELRNKYPFLCLFLNSCGIMDFSFKLAPGFYAIENLETNAPLELKVTNEPSENISFAICRQALDQDSTSRTQA